MKTRLLGAAVLIALAVLFVPMFFSSTPPAPGGDQSVSLAIPPAPDRDLETRTMSLAPDGAVVTPPAAATGQSGDQLPTVEIGSQRPRDVETDPDAGKAPVPTTVRIGSGDSPAQPVIPMRDQPDTTATAAAKAPAAPAKPATAPEKPAAAPTAAPATGHGSYTLNLSAYASASGAAALQRKVRALGYPVAGHAISKGGKPRTLVIAGPFETRTAAEAARLKIVQSIPDVPARLEQDASHAGEPAAPAAAPTSAPSKSLARAGGWAVQVAAMSTAADANVLRNQLRGAGFDGYVDSAVVGGKTLWRVRAGPLTQRADAQRVQGQIKSKLGKDGVVVSVP